MDLNKDEINHEEESTKAANCGTKTLIQHNQMLPKNQRHCKFILHAQQGQKSIIHVHLMYSIEKPQLNKLGNLKKKV